MVRFFIDRPIFAWVIAIAVSLLGLLAILILPVDRYPQIAHLVPRDLLWFFGGDCLHFMPDEEIALYQALDERRFEAEENDEPFDWNQEKQLLALPTDGSKH